MDALEIAGAILGLAVAVVGPGSGIWIVYKRAWAQAATDIGEIKDEMKRRGESAHADNVALMRALDRIEENSRDIVVLQRQVNHHASQITGIRVRCDLLHERPPGGEPTPTG